MISLKKVLDVQILTIVISALIIITIRVFAKLIKEGTMEVVDEDYREDYRRTKGYVGKSILVLVLTLALLFVIYKYYIDNVENE